MKKTNRCFRTFSVIFISYKSLKIFFTVRECSLLVNFDERFILHFCYLQDVCIENKRGESSHQEE